MIVTKRMNSNDIERRVRSDIDDYRYFAPRPGSTVGVPWSEEKVRSYIAKLERALVEPVLQRFVVRDTYEQMQRDPPLVEAYWIVARTGMYIEFFDPEGDEYGLAQDGGVLPVTIGVRGDLVGVFCAM